MSQKIAVIAGPTATGKTALGITLAKRLGGEVISADAMQVYRAMNIGTAKTTVAEQQGIRHHMLDVASPFESYSVARYVQEASACADDILSRGRLPIVVGGTGLYIEALIAGNEFSPVGDAALRQRLSDRYDGSGGEALLEELARVDPQAGARLHANDKKRIIRALEIFELTGKPMSEHDSQTKKRPPRYDACRIVLSYGNRAELYEAINRRVDNMMADGLLGEVRQLLDAGLTLAHTAMQAIGYKELARAITTNQDIQVAVDEIKRETRRYAKRQLSWFRREPGAHWILWEKEPDFDTGLQLSTKYLETNG
ncbi:tRNA (adenosine(37)-N6)-dimethylallyltransferase MiaA [Oscillospiraceae bacterium CM]|nr:tRNA (adenosine(37)-N6)-dimethylallyltransferase MiaA [Oscillospiraceae bacterium CM]